MNNACFFSFSLPLTIMFISKEKKVTRTIDITHPFFFNQNTVTKKRKNKIFFERSHDLYAIIDHVSKRTRTLIAMTTLV